MGCFRKPPLYLKHGDVVTCEVEGIGAISNKIVETPAEQQRVRAKSEADARKAQTQAQGQRQEEKEVGKVVLVNNYNRFAGTQANCMHAAHAWSARVEDSGVRVHMNGLTCLGFGEEQ